MFCLQHCVCAAFCTEAISTCCRLSFSSRCCLYKLRFSTASGYHVEGSTCCALNVELEAGSTANRVVGFCFDGCLVVYCESTGTSQRSRVCRDWQVPLEPAAVGNSCCGGIPPFLGALNLVMIMVQVVGNAFDCANRAYVFMLTFGRRSRR